MCYANCLENGNTYHYFASNVMFYIACYETYVQSRLSFIDIQFYILLIVVLFVSRIYSLEIGYCEYVQKFWVSVISATPREEFSLRSFSMNHVFPVLALFSAIQFALPSLCCPGMAHQTNRVITWGTKVTLMGLRVNSHLLSHVCHNILICQFFYITMLIILLLQW